MIKYILYAGMIVFAVLSGTAYCQNDMQVLGQVANVYGLGSSDGLFAGFSMWGLVGGLFFSCVGFIAFMYGKKNSELRPLLIGIALMACPYFIRGTVTIYLIGIGLCAALYFFRE